jgi:hypothetical protein
MEQTECSEKLAYKIQTPVNYPEEKIQHSEHGESLKSRITERKPLSVQNVCNFSLEFLFVKFFVPINT